MQLTSRKYAAIVGSLRKAAANSGSDKRKFTRIEVQARITFAVIRPDGGLFSVSSGLSRDVSMAGLGMLEAMHLQAGSELAIELPMEDGDPLLMRCVVKFCRPIANGIFSVGAEFIEEADDELKSHWKMSQSLDTERIRSTVLS